MSATIKKVVKLSYEQYHDLITTGKTTDKDGNEHIYDSTGNTSYNVYGYDELMALNNKIDKNIIEKNKVHPNYFNWLKIEDECAKIQKDNNEYMPDGSKLSFIALRGYLTKGSTIKASPSNINADGFGNVYLNGTKLIQDYTYEGDGVEYVSIVIFDKAEDVTFGILESEFEFKTIFECAMYNYSHEPVVSNSLWESCIYFVSYNCTPKGTIIAPNEFKLLGASSQKSGLTSKPYRLNQVVIEMQTMNPFSTFFQPYDTSSSYTLDLSKVKYIAGGDRSNGNIKANANIILKDLLTIKAGFQNILFNGISSMEIPEGVTDILGYGSGGSFVFQNIGTLILHCKNATFDNYWAKGTNTKILTLEEGWNTSLTCASFTSLPLNNFIEIIRDKLANRTGQDALIFTVPTAIFATLNTELCDVEGYTDKTWIEYATQVKNWTIQGG